jgi:hypothetical protein
MPVTTLEDTSEVAKIEDTQVMTKRERGPLRFAASGREDLSQILAEVAAIVPPL